MKKPNYYKFLVKFSFTGELEIQAPSVEEAEDIVRNMSDREIEHLSEFDFANMIVDSEPEIIY